MKVYTPSKRTLFLWRIRCALILAICIIPAFILRNIYYYLFMFSAAITAILFSFVYLPLFLNSYELKVSKNAVIIKRGVIIKKESIMPNARQVFAERVITPVARIFSVSSIVFRAARALTVTAELDNSDTTEILEVIKG